MGKKPSNQKSMFRKRILNLPIGIWLLGILMVVIYYGLRAFFIEQDDLRDAIALQRGLDRSDEWSWHGHHPLGLLPLYLLTRPLALLWRGAEVLDWIHLIGALAVSALGLLLYHWWYSRCGLEQGMATLLLLFFYFTNIVFVAATMMGQFALNALFLFLSFWWCSKALVENEVGAPRLLRWGLLGGILSALHLFLAIPPMVLGILLSRRQGTPHALAPYWGAFVGTLAFLYLAVYLLLAPQMRVGASLHPKPGILTWLIKGEAGSLIEGGHFSGVYALMIGERLQDLLLPLGVPSVFRIRDVWQYYTYGRLNTFLKGFYLLTLLATLIALWYLRGSDRQRVSEEWRLLWQFWLIVWVAFGAGILVWQGWTLGLYFWFFTLFMIGFGLWMVQFNQEARRSLALALASLTVVLILFSLQKGVLLRREEVNDERALAAIMHKAFSEKDVLIVGLKPAYWVLYYSPKARVILPEYEPSIDTILEKAVQTVTESGGRVIVWDFALDTKIYHTAFYAPSAEWSRSLEKAKLFWEELKPASWREYDLMIFPTRQRWSGSIRYFQYLGGD